MELTDYINLDLGRKACILCEKGVYVDKYIDFQHISSLYFLNNFFIEIVVSSDDNHVLEIVPFKNSRRLEKYVRHLTVQDFY